MSLELIHAGRPIGHVVRSTAGSVYAYALDGSPLGTFADIDAAALALIARAAA